MGGNDRIIEIIDTTKVQEQKVDGESSSGSVINQHNNSILQSNETIDNKLLYIKGALDDNSSNRNYQGFYRFLSNESQSMIDKRWVEERPEAARKSDLREISQMMDCLGVMLQKQVPYNAEERIMIINALSGYYDSKNCMWSSEEISASCDRNIHLMNITENGIARLLEEYKESIKQSPKTSNPQITSAGRRRLQANTRLYEHISPLLGTTYSQTMDTKEMFVYENMYRINGLKLLISELSLPELEANWGVIFIFAMNFLDGTHTLVKIDACNILNTIFGRLTPGDNIIIRAGVGPVIFDSIVPIILALPSLTPEKISERALTVGYDTIFQLWHTTVVERKDFNEKISMLLNDYLCPSMVKVTDIPKLLNILLRVVDEKILTIAGDYVIALRKQILYTILEILSNPFITYSSTTIDLCLNIITDLGMENTYKHRYDISACLGKVLLNYKKGYGSDNKIQDRIDSILKHSGLEVEELNKINREIQ